jgi:tRNA dimethylallyltransferase
MGPTASGKTRLALELSERLPHLFGSVISVDSSMVYRGMDIGTAKPNLEERAKLPHHLIDIRDPSDSYSAGDFRRDALKHIENISSVGQIPLLVGGTMLYFRALQRGIADLPKADPQIRARLSQEMENLGIATLHQRLLDIDATAGARINVNDAQRIQRALELYELTGKSPSELFSINASEPLPYTIINIAICPQNRTVLHKRIAERFAKMLHEGFIAEVEELQKRSDLSSDLSALRSVGYRQAWKYLKGEISYDNMCEEAVVATRQLAKRQLTWLRSWPHVVWFYSDDRNLSQTVADYILKEMKN